MSERNPALVINDIQNSIERIELYTAGLSFDQFSDNFMATEACLYNLQVIGEAVFLWRRYAAQK